MEERDRGANLRSVLRGQSTNSHGRVRRGDGNGDIQVLVGDRERGPHKSYRRIVGGAQDIRKLVFDYRHCLKRAFYGDGCPAMTALGVPQMQVPNLSVTGFGHTHLSR